MRFVRRRPFTCLAILTLILGALWHLPILPVETRVAGTPVVSVIGAPFIGAMRASRSVLGSSPVSPLAGTLLGVAPYLLADWFLARRRRQAA